MEKITYQYNQREYQWTDVNDAASIPALKNLGFTVRIKPEPFDPETWPKNNYGAFICTKEKPMPRPAPKGRWEHGDAKETDHDSDYYIEYKCQCCGHLFKCEMPD